MALVVLAAATLTAVMAIAWYDRTPSDCTRLRQPVAKGHVDGSFVVNGSTDSRLIRTIVDKPGSYCVDKSIRIDGQYHSFTVEGPKLFSDDDQLMVIRSDNVHIDFRDYSAKSDAALDSAISTPYLRKYATSFMSPLPTAPNNISLKNGIVKIDRTGVGVSIRGLGPETYANTREEMRKLMGPRAEWDATSRDEYFRNTGRRLRILSEMFPHGPSAYPVRNIRLENMKIKTKQDAVVLEGASTVIRDSVIETDSGTAIWLYGPNAVLENNTIIVRCLETKLVTEGLATCRELDAPIRLMHGDGALIRNNRFILKSNAHQRVISVFETGAFTFENNTIVGLRNIDSVAKAFTGELRMTGARNQLDNSPWAIFKSWFGR
jgi:Right handed beta helix region